MSALSETLNVRVTAELRAELERQAEQEKRKPSDLHRLLLEDALARRPAATRRSSRVG